MIDPTAVLHVLEALRISQGRLSGERFHVLPWQRKFIRGAFRDGVQSAALSIARGNGKTTLAAGLAIGALLGPMRVRRGEALIVASSLSQARIAFEHCIEFIGPLIRDEPKRWRIQDSAQLARIEDRKTGARVRCIGSDPRRAHGLAPTLTIADEPAQWPESTGERMRAALVTAAGKQPHSLFLGIGTRPADEGHWFARMLAGGADYAQMHAAPPDAPPFQARTWSKANPSLPYMPDLLAAIRGEADAARHDPSLLAAFRALRLNQGTADTEVAVLLDAGTWERIEGDPPRAGPCCWGIDLGTSAAQSAVAAYWPETGRLECLAAFPADPPLAERGLRDGCGRLYVECAHRGELLTLGGAAVPVADLIAAALERFGEPAAIACDRWREAELRDALQAAYVPLTRLELRGMGFLDGAADVRALRRACAEGKVRPIRSLLLSSAMAEARTVSDPAGNAKLSKGSQGGRRLRARDDAAAAAILAVALGSRQPERPKRTWRYQGVVG